MHKNIKNLIYIQNEIKSKIFEYKIKDYNPNIIAISKTFKIDHILPLIEYGHIHFGENKIQEAMDKWSEIKNNNIQIKLHMVGKLQTNKVKFAIKIFDYIHSVDNFKLAKKISDEQKKNNKKPKIFIQINVGDEPQKSGINKSEIKNFYNYCKNLNLNVTGVSLLNSAGVCILSSLDIGFKPSAALRVTSNEPLINSYVDMGVKSLVRLFASL